MPCRRRKTWHPISILYSGKSDSHASYKKLNIKSTFHRTLKQHIYFFHDRFIDIDSDFNTGLQNWESWKHYTEWSHYTSNWILNMTLKVCECYLQRYHWIFYSFSPTNSYWVVPQLKYYLSCSDVSQWKLKHFNLWLSFRGSLLIITLLYLFFQKICNKFGSINVSVCLVKPMTSVFDRTFNIMYFSVKISSTFLIKKTIFQSLLDIFM